MVVADDIGPIRVKLNENLFDMARYEPTSLRICDIQSSQRLNICSLNIWRNHICMVWDRRKWSDDGSDKTVFGTLSNPISRATKIYPSPLTDFYETFSIALPSSLRKTRDDTARLQCTREIYSGAQRSNDEGHTYHSHRKNPRVYFYLAFEPNSLELSVFTRILTIDRRLNATYSPWVAIIALIHIEVGR